ncbi:hypothetical protein B296_00028951 [Ensete ventricosum]|uniref:Uncharacterized protein n=1 Tax=Ensete ventricosum TaxID=4639 RepID=A0A426XPW2_ENSVE|nr:hypothetical protein B296_00028951 [Ensete ventricosum]
MGLGSARYRNKSDSDSDSDSARLLNAGFSPGYVIMVAVVFKQPSEKPSSQFRIVCMVSSAAGSPYDSGDENPYGAAYTRKRKDAERRGDEAYLAKVG